MTTINQNSGYGQAELAALLSAQPVSGKIFLVADSTNANINDLDALLPPDYAGNARRISGLDTAIGACTANRGDIILCAPGHAETLATAGAIAADVAGITIIGLGNGANRPTLTFSATDATFTVSAANVKIKNIIVKPSIDAVVSPFVVSAADCELDIEVQDASSSVECVRGVLTTAAANRLKLNLRYRGFTGGDACVNAVRLVGGTGADVKVDFFGKASTAVVEFLTTAVVDCDVTGTFYVSGTTNFSKNVVDTVSGSSWTAQGFDGAAGSSFSGGSGAALAGDDVSSIASALLVPSADASTNTNERDVIGNKTDAAVATVGTTSSLMAYTKGLTNSVYAIPRSVEKSDGAVLSGADPLFTITGGPIQIVQIIGIVTTTLGSGTANAKLTITTTTPSATVDMNAAAVDIDADAAGTSYRSINTTAIFTPVTAGFVMEGNAFATNDTQFLAPIGTINFTSDAALSGVIKWYLRYIPLSENSRVVAAA